MMSLRGDPRAFEHNQRLSMVMNVDNHALRPATETGGPSAAKRPSQSTLKLFSSQAHQLCYFVKYFINNL